MVVVREVVLVLLLSTFGFHVDRVCLLSFFFAFLNFFHFSIKRDCNFPPSLVKRLLCRLFLSKNRPSELRRLASYLLLLVLADIAFLAGQIPGAVVGVAGKFNIFRQGFQAFGEDVFVLANAKADSFLEHAGVQGWAQALLVAGNHLAR